MTRGKCSQVRAKSGQVSGIYHYHLNTSLHSHLARWRSRWRSDATEGNKKASTALWLAGLASEFMRASAEGVGFEPTVGGKPYSGLANRQAAHFLAPASISGKQ